MKAKAPAPQRLGALAASLAILWALGGCGPLITSDSGVAVRHVPSVAAHPPQVKHVKTPPAEASSTLPQPRGMYWASSTTGYRIAGGALCRTTNGGAAWTSWYRSVHLAAVAGSGTASLSVVAGSSLREIRDTGQVARSIAWPQAGPVQQISVPSPGVAYVRMAGHIYGYALGVAAGHWMNVSSTLGAVSAMVWLSSSDGYAAVDHAVWRTSSGGQSWARTFSAPVVGSGWTSQLAANSAQSVWLLLWGGVDGMSQTGFILWHGTEEGTRWTAVTDEAYWAPTGYPSVQRRWLQPSCSRAPCLRLVLRRCISLDGTQMAPVTGWC